MTVQKRVGLMVLQNKNLSSLQWMFALFCTVTLEHWGKYSAAVYEICAQVLLSLDDDDNDDDVTSIEINWFVYLDHACDKAGAAADAQSSKKKKKKNMQ